MAVHQAVAHGEVLAQADQRVIDGLVAVGVVLTQHVAHAGGGFFKGLIAGQAAFVHGVEDAAVDRLQAVPDVRQGAADNDGHRVFDVRFLHLVFQIDVDDLLIGKGNVPFLVRSFSHMLSP